MGAYGSPELHPKLRQNNQPSTPPPKKPSTEKDINVVAGVCWCVFTLIVLIATVYALCTLSPEQIEQYAATNTIVLFISFAFCLAVLLVPKILTIIFLFEHERPRLFIIPFGILLFANIIINNKAAIFLLLLIIAYLFLSPEIKKKAVNITFFVCCLAMELIVFIYYVGTNTYDVYTSMLYITSYSLFLIYIYLFNNNHYINKSITNAAKKGENLSSK